MDPFDLHRGTCGDYSIECEADRAIVEKLKSEGFEEEACKRAALAVSQAVPNELWMEDADVEAAIKAALKEPWNEYARIKAARMWANAHKHDDDFNMKCPDAYVKEKSSERSSFSGKCEVLRIHVRGLLSRVSALELEVTPVTRDELEWRKMELKEMKRRDPHAKLQSWELLPDPPRRLRRAPMRAKIAIQKEDEAADFTEAAERAAALKKNRGRYVFDGEFAQVVNTDGVDHFDVRLIPTATTRQTDAERMFQRRASKRLTDGKAAWTNAHLDFMVAMGRGKTRATRVHYWGPGKVTATGSKKN